MSGMLALSTASVGAQGYRVRLDAQAQSVSFRGLVSDSIAASLVVPSVGGGLETPDGHAVRCGAGDQCYFFRPGGILRTVPASTSANVVLWGFGVQGLTGHASGRLLADLGRDEVWPGTDPTAQLLEAYLQYERASVLARAGRQLVNSRLEPIGFDGGWLRYRWDDASLDVTAYGGWGLGQASAVPFRSPALNPLDEWRPRDRQLVAGAEAAWHHRNVDLRAEYRREIDPQDDYFVSERTALSLGARAAAFRLTGGVDYNMAEGHVGSADATVTYLQPRFSVSGGARRYRPYFSLWTLWSAFSPVPYHALHVAGQVRATNHLTLRVRGEGYRYEDADASTALVPQLEDGGWRVHTGAMATLGERWTIDANLGLEHGPGAAGRFVDGTVTYVPGEQYAFALYGGSLARPLELRFYDATSRWIGGRADWQISASHRVWGDLALVGDERERPDAGATSLNQVRMRAGVSLSFGTATDRMPLPPARRSRP